MPKKNRINKENIMIPKISHLERKTAAHEGSLQRIRSQAWENVSVAAISAGI